MLAERHGRLAAAAHPLAIHSSGLGSIHLLKPLFEAGARVLCLHPLQTFSGEPRAELLRDVPCAVTAHEERDLQLGDELARRLGMKPFRLADEQKTLYHLAAAIGSNLLVALESEAARLMDQASDGPDGLDVLAPLLRATLANLLERGPSAALTGPVARGDVGTVRAHLRLLDRESPRLAARLPRPESRGRGAGGAAARRRAGAHAAGVAAPDGARAAADAAGPTAARRTATRTARHGRARRPRRDPEGRRDRRPHQGRGAGRAAATCRGRSAWCRPWAPCTRAI